MRKCDGEARQVLYTFHFRGNNRFLDLSVHKHSYLFELADQVVNKKLRIVHGQGASNINYSIVVFNFHVCRRS